MIIISQTLMLGKRFLYFIIFYFETLSIKKSVKPKILLICINKIVYMVD